MTIRTSAPRNAMFDRLGGFDGVDHAVQRLFARMAADPTLSGLMPTKGAADARWQVQMLLTDRLGGPMAYDGPDPLGLRGDLGIDGEKASRIEAHLLAAFQEGGASPELMEDLRSLLADELAKLGLHTPSVAPRPDPRQALIAQALEDATQAGFADRPLFVLDPDLTLVHLNPDAERGLEAARADLRRAFGLAPEDLAGHSILRFHPAPSQFQGLLQDVTRLPKETTWCFGHMVWKARVSAVRSREGALLGYGISWRDETDLHRAEAVFQRLRNQAEDLPVPIMYPDPMLEKWFGNAACEHALERLAGYLPFPVNPLDGVPVQLFLPDEGERRALFRDPARLPYKSQIRMGPETIAILVSPIRDEDQRYLGPQITWEIVHFTRKEDRAPAAPKAATSVAAPAQAPTPAVPPAANPSPAPVMTAPAPVAAPSPASAPVGGLRGEARALEAAATELQTLVHLLDLVADQAEGQGTDAMIAETPVPDAGATGQADAAIAAALVAVRRAAAEAAAALALEARDFTVDLQHRVRDTVQRTQGSAEALGKIMTAAQGLGELRASLGGAEAGALNTAPAAEVVPG